MKFAELDVQVKYLKFSLLKLIFIFRYAGIWHFLMFRLLSPTSCTAAGEHIKFPRIWKVFHNWSDHKSQIMTDWSHTYRYIYSDEIATVCHFADCHTMELIRGGAFKHDNEISGTFLSHLEGKIQAADQSTDKSPLDQIKLFLLRPELEGGHTLNEPCVQPLWPEASTGQARSSLRWYTGTPLSSVFSVTASR